MPLNYTPSGGLELVMEARLSYNRLLVNEWFSIEMGVRRDALERQLREYIALENMKLVVKGEPQLQIPDYVRLGSFVYRTLGKIVELEALKLIYDGKQDHTTGGKKIQLNELQARDEAMSIAKSVMKDVTGGVERLDKNIIVRDTVRAFYAYPNAEYDPAWADTEVEFLKSHGFEVPKKEPEAPGPKSLGQRAVPPAVTPVQTAAQ